MNLRDPAYMLLGAIAAPFWLRKSRSDWGARMGKAEPLPSVGPGKRGRVMLHAVSVGEVNALRRLVPLLTSEADVVISVTTDTGIARARELYADTCTIVRYPLDFSWSVRRFLDAVRPDAVALIELELWPNFVDACVARSIPVGVINGRLSERSFKGYRKIKRLIAPAFGKLAFAAVQDTDYAERFEHMGVRPNDCLLTGSMKWDAAEITDKVEGAEELARDLGIDRSRPLIVAGSTGPGEEALLHEACPEGAQLLCAPRKPERFDDAAAAMPGCVRRSRPGSGGSGSRDPGSGRFLLDTIGELRAAYALADVVVVGRSFGDLYGSDPMEPGALAKPLVIGPAVSDFASSVASFDKADAIVRTSRDRLAQDLRALLDDPARRAELGRNARGCVAVNQGASERHAEILLSLFKG